MVSSTMKAWGLGLAIAFAAISVPQRVGAAPHVSSGASTQRARRHFLSGKRAFEGKRYALALKEFEAGYAIDPRPGFLLNMGHAARRLGELRRAKDYYLKFLESDPPAPERRAAIALVTEIDRELSPPPSSHASTAPEPAAVTPPPVASPPPVETAAVAVVASTETPAPPPIPPPTAVEPQKEAVKQAAQEVAREKTHDAPAPRVVVIPEPRRAAAPAAASPAVTLTLSDSRANLVAPSRAAEQAPSPIYRRWWFWAGTGVAAGVVTAILIGTLGSGSSARDSGTWGQIKL